MALRRPPTRIELKADDVEEYDKVICFRCRLAYFRHFCLLSHCNYFAQMICIHCSRVTNKFKFCSLVQYGNTCRLMMMMMISADHTTTKYYQIMKERKSLAEQLAMKGQTTHQKNTPTNNSNSSFSFGVSNSSSFSFGVSPVSSQKKPSAAERIGYQRPR